MSSAPVSGKIMSMGATMAPIITFYNESNWAKQNQEPNICDFTFGNPHDKPLEPYVDAVQNSLVPQNKDWFAYKQSVPEAQEVIAKTITTYLDHTFNPEDICITNGAFAGLNVVIKTIVDAGDEIIYISPHWFAYEGMIIGAGGKAVNISIDPATFDLDLNAIEQAISPKTRGIIINSPHNPTGKIYSRETLEKVASILTEASKRNGRTIYLISDEAYHQIIFDDNKFVSPATIYPNTFLVYTYGKVHLTPGQRIGYIALPPEMENRAAIQEATNLMQAFSGWSYPNAILQYAIPDLVKLSIDIEQLQWRRDFLIEKLTEQGYETNHPAGTFYLIVKSPIEDDWAFVEHLSKHKVFALPGMTFGLPGYFRLSLTANDDMVKRSIDGFAKAIQSI